ncbi:MAG TPA: hypothetical protein VFE33_28455 [Thermoanaerobaculia bacterium]|nr:hypothetical protein [Thermoanaerobaculia bacterium]
MTLDRLPRPAAFRLVLFLLLVAAGAPPLQAGVNFWTPIGPNGGPVYTLAIDPVTPTTLYAGTNGGVFKSVDGGASWTLASRGLGNHLVVALTLDPHQPTHLFAVTELGLVFRSTDGAATWQTATNAPTGGITSLVIDSQNPATLYASSFAARVWRSTDGGKTWQQRSVTSIFGFSLLADPVHSGTLYSAAGTDTASFVLSTDGGVTWVNRDAGLPRRVDGRGETQIALDPEVPTTLYAAIRTDYDQPSHLFVSRDAGLHWEADGPGGLPLATGPGGAVYAGTARSLDHGQTWTTVQAPAVEADEFDLAVSPVSPTLVYANTASGLFRSTDGASSWQPLVNGLAATTITALAVRPATPIFVLAGVDKVGIQRGRPAGGATWKPVAPSPGPQKIVFDPANPAVVYAQTYQQISRSTDGGLSWEDLALPAVTANCASSAFLRAIAVGPGVVYAGINLPAHSTCTPQCSLFKSVDQGASWTCLTLRTPDVRSLAVAPSAPSVVYATESTNLWKSTNGGTTWTALNHGWQRVTTELDLVVIDPTRADVLYLSSANGLLKSTNGGVTWALVNRGLPANSILDAVVIDPSTPTTVYAGFRFSGVYRSVDGGKRWFPQVGGLKGFSGALAIDPLHSATLYAGTPANGVYTLTEVP